MAENIYSQYVLIPGVDVYDAELSHLGSIDSIRVSDSGKDSEVAEISFLCPASHQGGECLPPHGYLVVRGGLLSTQRLKVPFEAISDVTDAGIVLSRTKQQLITSGA
jgi:hypothetical protein